MCYPSKTFYARNTLVIRYESYSLMPIVKTLTLSLKLRNPNIRCLDRTIAIADFDAIESGIALVEISAGAFWLSPPCGGNDIPVADGGRR